MMKKKWTPEERAAYQARYEYTQGLLRERIEYWRPKAEEQEAREREAQERRRSS
jgi:hypothetical protein